MRIQQRSVAVSPIACIYSSELSAIEAALTFVFAHLERIFGDRKNRNVVLVTDSKSSLECVRRTWQQRVGYVEQNVARRLFDLATSDIHTTLAFVFSHVGGAPGNEFVDKRAQAACNAVGRKWTNSLWLTDTARRILRNRHEQVDRKAANGSNGDGEAPFRFRNLPAKFGLQPSAANATRHAAQA